jgi:8-oxo-dGTP diphosphatase
MADSNVVVVDVRSRGVDLPGGHVEEHETSATQTLKRELIEEANVTVKDLELLDVLLVSSDLIGPNDKCYIVIFLANVDTLGEFTPNDEIGNRLILNVDEFSEQYFAHAPEYIRHLFTIATQS